MSLYVITKLMILSYIIAYHNTFPTFNYCVAYSIESLSGSKHTTVCEELGCSIDTLEF